jgi:hypothetical protein
MGKSGSPNGIQIQMPKFYQVLPAPTNDFLSISKNHSI